MVLYYAFFFFFHFNSRPHEEADPSGWLLYKDYNISTHGLTRRPTEKSGKGMYLWSNFNSRPHEEADSPALKKFLEEKEISTHGLTRRPTRDNAKLAGALKFQLTASRGGRLFGGVENEKYGTFQLTASRGGRPVRLLPRTYIQGISTHGLTRRPTDFVWFSIVCYIISTHGLTRRPTHLRLHIDRLQMISTHGLTRRPTRKLFLAVLHDTISTHGLTRRPTQPSKVKERLNQFQLTASRGGRLLLSLNHKKHHYYFNSRPHEEADMHEMIFPHSNPSFQLTASRGGRRNPR